MTFHAIARAMRPPSSGKAGIRLKTKSPALTSASQPSTASAGARVVAQDERVDEVAGPADEHAADAGHDHDQQRDRRSGGADAELLARRLAVAVELRDAAEEPQVDARRSRCRCAGRPTRGRARAA